jgi:hypothetical protein
MFDHPYTVRPALPAIHLSLACTSRARWPPASHAKPTQDSSPQTRCIPVSRPPDQPGPGQEEWTAGRIGMVRNCVEAIPQAKKAEPVILGAHLTRTPQSAIEPGSAIGASRTYEALRKITPGDRKACHSLPSARTARTDPERQIQHVPRWDAGQGAQDPTMAFFQLSGMGPGSRPGIGVP